MLVVRRLASVADALAVARCDGVPLDRCAFVVAPTADRKAGASCGLGRCLRFRGRSAAPGDALCMEKWPRPKCQCIDILDWREMNAFLSGPRAAYSASYDAHRSPGY